MLFRSLVFFFFPQERVCVLTLVLDDNFLLTTKNTSEIIFKCVNSIVKHNFKVFVFLNKIRVNFINNA